MGIFSKKRSKGAHASQHSLRRRHRARQSAGKPMVIKLLANLTAVHLRKKTPKAINSLGLYEADAQLIYPITGGKRERGKNWRIQVSRTLLKYSLYLPSKNMTAGFTFLVRKGTTAILRSQHNVVGTRKEVATR